MMFADRAVNEPILCTQEQIANTLGVRRERVARAASTLQKKGLIRYARGKIELLNKKALLTHTCECYALINAAYKPLVLQHSLR